MKVVATFHQPCSVISSIKCQLASRDVEYLVVAKLNRLDVYSIQPQGLHHQCSAEIWGIVHSIKAIPIPGTSRSTLVVLLAHPDPEIVFFSYTESEGGTAQLSVKKQLSLYERTPRQAEYFSGILVHPSGTVAVAQCYIGKLKIITLKSGNYVQDFDVSLPELNTFSLAFLPLPDDVLSLAILHLDHQERIQLLARDISIGDLELSPSRSLHLHPTVVSDKNFPFPTDDVPALIPIPPQKLETDMDTSDDDFLGGVLIVGGKKILLYELSSVSGQAKQKGKRTRLESRLSSADKIEATKAKEKEEEREGRRRKPKASVDWPWSEVTAWCAVESPSSRFFISDSYGRLSMLSVGNFKDYGLALLPLGETSPPTTLTYLANQILYVGSHQGDSQIIQISPNPTSSTDTPTLPIPRDVKTVSDKSFGTTDSSKGKEKAADEDIEMSEEVETSVKGCVIETMGSYINVLDTHKNIAPIADAILVDTDGSGQKQIVACSGGRNTGSISVVRSGADFQELAVLSGLTDIVGIWPVRTSFEDKNDSGILVSTLERTHIFQISGTGRSTYLTLVDESLAGGLITNGPTLAFANVAQRTISATKKATYGNSSLVVQVTSTGVYLLEYDIAFNGFLQKANWLASSSLPPGSAPSEITTANINPSQVTVSLNGGRLYVLSITEKTELRVSLSNTSTARLSEISAISCTPLNEKKSFTQHIPVAYWDTNTVEIFGFSDNGIKSLCKSSPHPTLIRSILLYNFGFDHSSKEEDYHPYLLLGTADGSVISYTWRDNKLSDKKVVSLGYAPVSLTASNIDGKRIVFAAGNRATILSWEKTRLHHSPITLKEVRAACSISSPMFPSSLVLATPMGLFIGRVRDLDKMHIRSIPLGLDNPRRIVYEPSYKAFGVACTRTEPGRIGDTHAPKSSFKLLDDTNFSLLSQYNPRTDEEITAVVPFRSTFDGTTNSYFCLGSYIYRAEEKEPVSGRLVVLNAFIPDVRTAKPNLELSHVASADVEGCVYVLAVKGDMIAAAVNSSVMIFSLTRDGTPDVPSPSFSLSLVCEWNHNYLVTSLVSIGDHLVAGDQINSVSLLKIANSKIHSVARDYGPLWPISLGASDEKHIIGANDSLNLFTFSLAKNMGRSVLERDGSYYIADLVTKFIPGSLSTSEISVDPPLLPEHVFVTTSGRISVVVNVENEEVGLQLTKLQRNLASNAQGIGGISHTRYRAPKTSRGRSDADSSAFGFLDGDFLEQFLGLLGKPGQLEKVMEGQTEPERLTLSTEEIQKLLENLQGLH